MYPSVNTISVTPLVHCPTYATSQMTNTLHEHLRATFTSAAVSELARLLGDTNLATQKAIDGLLPTIISGVVHRAQTEEGATTLYRLLTTTSFDTDPSLAQLAQTDSHRQKAAESGNRLLGELFPDRVERLAQSTAQYSGVSRGTATTLTGLVMSVLMGYLHGQTKSRNLTGPQLATQLGSEATTVNGAIPAAFAGLVGWFIGGGPARAVTPTNPVTTTTIPATTVTPTHRDDDTKAAAFPWLRWLLIGLGLLGLFLLLTRMCNRDETTTTQTTETADGPAMVATDTVAQDLDGNEGAAGADSANTRAGASGPQVRVGVDLPGGRRLNLVENSFTYSLARYLATKGGQTPKVFIFDNLTFEPNSSRISASAQSNVDDLIQIMQAYPSLNIRIEGHSDSTGLEDVNDRLSAERADAVRAALVQSGIDGGRITTRERGEDKPVSSNQTKAGRENNRRIDVVVTRL